MINVSWILSLILLCINVSSCTVPPTTVMNENASSLKRESLLDDPDLRVLWDDEIQKLDKKSKDYPLQKLRILQSLLSRIPPEQARAGLERITSSSVAYSKLSEFEQTYVQVFVLNNTQPENRPQLVELLSAKCPRFVGGEAIELYISNSNLLDAPLVFVDSYNKAANEQARTDLLSVLGDSFRSVRVRFPSDESFLRESKEWYLKNKDKLRVNPYYQPDSPFPDNQQLFLPKS